MVIPASYASRWLAIPWLAQTVGSLPFLIQLPLAIVVADLSQYATHRAFHTIPFLWRFHAIHHSIETMDWVAGSRSHYVDILLTRGLILIPMTIFGFSQATLAGYLVFVSFHATFCHTDFRPRTIWLEPYFVTVRYHHWHHAADPEAVDVNFAIHLPFIDRLFGTHYLPKDAWPERYGLVGGSSPARLLRAVARAVQARRGVADARVRSASATSIGLSAPVADGLTSPSALIDPDRHVAEVELARTVSGAEQVRIVVMVVLPAGAERRHHRQPVADVHRVVVRIVVAPRAPAAIVRPVVLHHIHPQREHPSARATRRWRTASRGRTTTGDRSSRPARSPRTADARPGGTATSFRMSSLATFIVHG